ncbi:hypothetical protein Q1695_001752 [Nippostrongylus brasiliensis]|nr:hypothetical protein Q1695_001752 [Nippostrongylus brasiliensis]
MQAFSGVLHLYLGTSNDRRWRLVVRPRGQELTRRDAGTGFLGQKSIPQLSRPLEDDSRFEKRPAYITSFEIRLCSPFLHTSTN